MKLIFLLALLGCGWNYKATVAAPPLIVHQPEESSAGLSPAIIADCYQLSDGSVMFHPNDKVAPGIGSTCENALRDYKTSAEKLPTRWQL